MIDYSFPYGSLFSANGPRLYDGLYKDGAVLLALYHFSLWETIGTNAQR